ncbi:MAG: hypothetical protein GKC04_01395 [Methanomicrobiales archaeon]|nr:hypothetical protein [Methanomicrobiales archaeon]
MKIAVIGDRYMVAGFGLAGIKIARHAASAAETRAALEECLQMPGIGVILIQDRCAAHVRQQIDENRNAAQPFPVILPVPGKEGAPAGADPAADLLGRALGRTFATGGKAE